MRWGRIFFQIRLCRSWLVAGAMPPKAAAEEIKRIPSDASTGSKDVTRIPSDESASSGPKPAG